MVTRSESKIKTSRKIVNIANEIGYKIIYGYIKDVIKIKLRCDKDHEYDVRPSAFIAGQRCPYCSGRKFEDPLHFDKIVSSVGHQLLTSYVDSRTKVKIRCSLDHEYLITPSEFKLGRRCTICRSSVTKHRKSEDLSYFAEKFEKLVLSCNYELLSPYVTSDKLVKVKCFNNHIYEVRPNSFNRGDRCIYCSGYKFDDPLHFDKIVSAAGYRLLTPYVKAHEHVKLICQYDHEYLATPHTFKKGQRCPICYTQNQYGGKNYISLVNRIQRSINASLKRDKSNEIWGNYYTINQLKDMSKNLYDFYLRTPKGHHVDHIVPCSYFNLSNFNELQACWNLRNLRYLPAVENLRRRNNLTFADIHLIASELYDISLIASRNHERFLIKAYREVELNLLKN